jgi:hypothetical protein
MFPRALLLVCTGAIICSWGRRQQGLNPKPETRTPNPYHLQVEKKATSLNSSDVFVLCEKDEVAIWYGRHGSKDERADGQGS